MRTVCTDKVIGNILAGWRYDISGLAPEMRGDYDAHLAECAHCQSRQVLHRTIDIVLMIVASISAIMFLVAFGAVRHYSPRHALLLELIALAGFLFFSVVWLIVAVATPAPVVVADVARIQARIRTAANCKVATDRQINRAAEGVAKLGTVLDAICAGLQTPANAVSGRVDSYKVNESTDATRPKEHALRTSKHLNAR